MNLQKRPSRGLKPRAAGDIGDMIIEIFGGVFETLFGGLSRKIGGSGCAMLAIVFVVIASGVAWYFLK